MQVFNGPGCPRNDESAGKRRSTRLRKGDLWLKTLLVQCAWAARRKKGSYFNAQFLRLRGRRGPKKMACAVAASLLTTIYHMLKDGTQFQDLGADHFDRRSKDVSAKRLVTQLATLASMPSSLPSPKRPEIVAMLTQIEPLPREPGLRHARGSVRRVPCPTPPSFL
jgi:transposase